MKERRQRWDRLDKSTIPLTALIDEYLAVCRTEGKTPCTLRGYKSETGRFARWLGDEATLGEFTLQSARAFIEDMQGRHKYEDHPFHKEQDKPLSAQTLKGRSTVLKGFATWLYEEGYTTSNVLVRFKPPKAPKKLMQILSAEEKARIFAYLQPTTLMGSRDLAIVLLFLDTGLRCAELLGLRTDNLHLNDRCLKIMGKGQKERIVSFGDRTAKALRRYQTLRSNRTHSDLVFLTVDGKPMKEAAIRMMFSRLAKATGIARLHIHLLRHTFATDFLRVSGDPFTLQRLLGHETLEMTRRYVDMVRLDEMTRERGLSPVDRLSEGRRGFGRPAG